MDEAPHATADLLQVDDRLFRLLVEAIEDYAIFLLDRRGAIVSWNKGAERITGFVPAEAIGRGVELLYPDDDRAAGKVARELELAARHGRVEDEGWRVRKDGTRFWADVVVAALHDAGGELIGFAKVTRDLSERRREEESLRRSEERFRLLVESVRDYAIFMLDADGRVVSWNPGAQRFKGYSAAEIVGRHFSVFYPPEDVAAGKCDWELAEAASVGRVEDEGWRVRKDGTRFWANVVITALRDPTGKLIGFAKVTRDLTDRKRNEQQLLEAEVARARAETRAAEATRALKARDEFISVASHELRTPLSAARLYVEGLERSLRRGDVPVERLQARLAHVMAQVERLDELVHTLLDASRLTLGKLALDPSDLDLVTVVRQELGRFEAELTAAGCPVRVQAPPSLPGRWDRLRLSQVLTNLLTNAMKYGAGKPIEITVDGDGGRARLRVRDHGIGIAPQDQRRIFERFERAVSERHFGGLGLGLWITRGIVEAMGGTIGVASRLGQGATFTVELPLA